MLEADGTPWVGARIENRQVLINKEMPLVLTKEEMGMAPRGGADRAAADLASGPIEYRPTPIDYKGIEAAYVERVMFASTEDKQHLVKVRFLQHSLKNSCHLYL